MNKAEWRTDCLQRRIALAPEERTRLSAAICSHLEGVVAATAGPVLAYLPFRAEPDLRLLMASVGTWAVPRTVGKTLAWHRYDPERVSPGAFGITEPGMDCEAVSAKDASLVLIPAVACDRLGYRLGYGGGYYDRLLSTFELRALAITYRQFVFDALPTDPWDRPLSGIATEEGVEWLKNC